MSRGTKVYPHGTPRRYVNNGCRCKECCAANTKRAAEYRARVKANGPATVPAKVVIPHLKKLSRAGIGIKPIALAVGAHKYTIFKLRTGKYKRLDKRLAEKILAVDESCRLDGALVPGAKTRKAVRRLKSLGVSRREIAEARGWAKNHGRDPKYKVTLRTQKIVLSLLEEVQQAVELGNEADGTCHECGLSHVREDRIRRLRRFDEIFFMDAHEAWPCIYPRTIAGERLFYYDRDEAFGTKRQAA